MCRWKQDANKPWVYQWFIVYLKVDILCIYLLTNGVFLLLNVLWIENSVFMFIKQWYYKQFSEFSILHKLNWICRQLNWGKIYKQWIHGYKMQNNEQSSIWLQKLVSTQVKAWLKFLHKKTELNLRAWLQNLIHLHMLKFGRIFLKNYRNISFFP